MDDILDDDIKEKDIVLRFTPKRNERSLYEDVAEEYIIARLPRANSGLVVYGKYHGKWNANPTSRPVIRELQNRLGIEI